MSNNNYCWLVAYIEATYLGKVERELKSRKEYQEVEVYIPTVKILKKKFKGKEQFQEVPLLFNYGFFKVPRELAVNKGFLDRMKENISCIFAWVRDPARVIGAHPKIKMDGSKVYEDGDVPIATATSEEIQTLLESSMDNSIQTSEEISRLSPGDFITLRGYPWEGLKAEIVEIQEKSRTIRVNINMFKALREAIVSFDNVFFTVYQKKGHDDKLSSTASLDEMIDNKTINRKVYKNAKGRED